MTLILDLDLDVSEMYMSTKNGVPSSRQSKVRARTGQTDRQTDRCDRTHYRAAFAVVIIMQDTPAQRVNNAFTMQWQKHRKLRKFKFVISFREQVKMSRSNYIRSNDCH